MRHPRRGRGRGQAPVETPLSPLTPSYEPRRRHQDEEHDDSEAVLSPPSTEFVSPDSLNAMGHVISSRCARRIRPQDSTAGAGCGEYRRKSKRGRSKSRAPKKVPYSWTRTRTHATSRLIALPRIIVKQSASIPPPAEADDGTVGVYVLKMKSRALFLFYRPRCSASASREKGGSTRINEEARRPGGPVVEPCRTR